MSRSRSVRVRRTLHLLDADNLLGDPRTCDRALIQATYAEYRRVACFVEGDHAVIATGVNGIHVLEAESAWPGARHLRRRGADGADLALLDEVDWATTSGRYHRVVIGSGDRIFLVAFELLIAAGLTVDIVSRREALATALAVRARGHVRYLRPIDSTPAWPGPAVAPTAA